MVPTMGAEARKPVFCQMTRRFIGIGVVYAG